MRRFYETWFIGHWPKDTSITRLSRTVDTGHVVDEIIVSFTHDCEMPAILPGVKPTGRKVVLPHVAVVGFNRLVWRPLSHRAQTRYTMNT